MQYFRHKINVTEINIKHKEYGHILVMTHSNGDIRWSSSLNVRFPWWLRWQRICLQCRRLDSILGSGRPLEKGMVIHSSILAWRIPWTEESCRLQS